MCTFSLAPLRPQVIVQVVRQVWEDMAGRLTSEGGPLQLSGAARMVAVGAAAGAAFATVTVVLALWRFILFGTS